MENSQLKDLQEEVSEATKQYILTTFNSENKEIASQLQFIVFLSGNTNIIKQLHGILQRHLSNVMLLLRSYPEHNIQE